MGIYVNPFKNQYEQNFELFGGIELKGSISIPTAELIKIHNLI
jgi:hypothetical protein